MIYLVAFLIAIVSAAVQSVTGFGYTVVSMTTLPFFLSPISSTTVSGLIGNIQSVYLCYKHRKHIEIKVMIVPLIAAVIFSAVAITYMAQQPSMFYKRILGVFLCMLSIYMIFFSNMVKIRATFLSGFVTGAVSGIATGLFGMGGPPTVMYMLAATKTKESYLSTIQFLFFLTGLSTTVVRFMNGAMTMEVLKLGAVSILGMVIGLTIGSKLFSLMTQEQVAKFVYSFMLIMGLIITVTA